MQQRGVSNDERGRRRIKATGGAWKDCRDCYLTYKVAEDSWSWKSEVSGKTYRFDETKSAESIKLQAITFGVIFPIF